MAPTDPFDKSFRPATGRAVELEPGVRVLAAPNPGPMTFTGTNTYLVGTHHLAIIDPGPDLIDHETAILAAVEGAKVSHILVTHSHVDHSPLARRLSEKLNAPVCGFGPAAEARSLQMAALAQEGDLGGGEGVDLAYSPDVALSDGDCVTGDGWALNALHTPGHLSDHLCFALGGTGAVFSGDHVMGWATTMVSPPDGDLTRFMASLDKMTERPDRIYYPGHGGPVEDPIGIIAWQKTHRQGREAQIREALLAGPATAMDLAQRIYTDIDQRLIPAAARNVLAHLIDLSTRNLAKPQGQLTQSAEFELISGI
ncbi:MAG: MBL fold metallo-hydrolase [Pseudomonadota bacterium]